MSIISKHYINSILINFVGILLILSLIIFGNQFFLVINRSFESGMFSSEIFSLMFLKLIRDMPLLVSLSLCLGIIYTINGFHKRSEVIIVNFGGLNEFDLVKKIISVIFIITFLIAVLAIIITPMSNKLIEDIKSNINSRPDYIFFKEGEFQNFQSGVTFFANDVENLENSDNQILNDIFIFSEVDDKLVFSQKGYKEIFDGDVFLRLNNGKIYENLSVAENNPAIINFEEYRISLFKKTDNLKNTVYKPQSKRIYELFLSNDLEDIAELFYRISIPILAVLASILSVYLSKHNPRNKRNFAFALAFISFIFYYYLILVVKIYVESSMVSPSFSLLPHIFFLLIILIINFLRNKFLLK